MAEYKFYKNNESNNEEIHIYKNEDFGDETLLCNDSRVEPGDLVGVFIGSNSIIGSFDENNARDFAQMLQNNDCNVCGRCVATLYFTQPQRFRLRQRGF